MKTQTTALTTVITSSDRNANTRRVFFTMPHVAPPGVDFSSAHGGRRFELTSYKGGAVEVYVESATTKLMMYQGTIAQYAPGGGSLLAAFAHAWFSTQPSAAARASFEASAVRS